MPFYFDLFYDLDFDGKVTKSREQNKRIHSFFSLDKVTSLKFSAKIQKISVTCLKLPIFFSENVNVKALISLESKRA
jgi:hypothetical protein